MTLPVLRHHATLGLVCLIVACVALTPTPIIAQDRSENVTLTLDQARNVAQQALQAGNPDLAIQIAGGLLQANPNDAFAHFVLASANAQKNNLRQGRKAAAQAYRFSETPIRKFESAQLAAQLSYAENRPTLTQIWMRRAVQHAPDEASESLIAREYAQVRAQNPWSFNIGVGLRPSDNVNNGADTALNDIDGVPATGILSPTARALSGVIGTLDLSLRYRLRGDGHSKTTLGGRVYVKQVWLSDDAQTQAPNARNEDFGSTYTEADLRHVFAIGNDGFGSLQAAIGRFWSGGEVSYNFGRVNIKRGWRLNTQSGVTLSGLVEQRRQVASGSADALVSGLGARYFQRLANDDVISFNLSLRDVGSDFINDTYQTAALRISYDFADFVGPVRVSTGVTFGYSDYSQYRVGFINVPGGRQDKTVLADITLLFESIDYAGFAPTLRIQAGKNRSNVGRFDTREFSISMGVQSKF